MTGYFGAIEAQTRENSYFRKVLFTGEHSQLVVMCLRPGEDTGTEMHPHVDQFFRIEQGEAEFELGEERQVAREGEAVLVPAGAVHNVTNASRTTPLRLYTIYSPPNHPDATLHETRADAMAAEAAESHRSQGSAARRDSL
jgi:mannose-6-phosphate isomerase-like protein (cupin superfamily)